MQRVQFYPSAALANILINEAKKNGVSVSTYVTDLLNEYYNLTTKNTPTITQLTTTVLNEVEKYVSNSTPGTKFDLNRASETYRKIDMTCGKKPSTVRASIGRSFASKIGKAPFSNVQKSIVNQVQELSINGALMYKIV